MRTATLAIILVATGLGGLTLGLTYTMTQTRPNYVPQSNYMMQSAWPQESSQPISEFPTVVSLDQAQSIAQQYLAATHDPNLALKEIMEFQYNFYIIFYERDTGRGAFEMLIWKEAPPYGMMGGGMMNGYVVPGVMTPEPGPNMMWNAKYSLRSNGMMGYYGSQWSFTVVVSPGAAAQLAQAYLSTNFSNARVEMGTEFYGYYTFDFTVNGKIAGMLSVNGRTGQVWYHSWHGDFIQEVEFT